MVVLKVDSLTKDYGSFKAVDNLSFEFRSGEVYGILGPNGSGKTTTLAMLSDVVRPSSGTFSWFGTSPDTNQRKRLGVMLEKPNFYDYLNAIDNLKIVADIRGIDYSDIEPTLKQIGLFERRKSRFKTFSLGMKQRLAIGATILGDPDVLVLDEPTNGLDPEGIAEVRNLIINLAKGGKTIILASHLLDEVQKVCTQMVVLKKGVKIFQGEVNGISGQETIIEVKSDDNYALINALNSSKFYTNYSQKNDLILIKMDSDKTSTELNAYLHSKSIVVSHLAYRVKSLEENILKLLNDVQ
jgi:ABC-2 type transport system ATP-binding protein